MVLSFWPGESTDPISLWCPVSAHVEGSGGPLASAGGGKALPLSSPHARGRKGLGDARRCPLHPLGYWLDLRGAKEPSLLSRRDSEPPPAAPGLWGGTGWQKRR